MLSYNEGMVVGGALLSVVIGAIPFGLAMDMKFKHWRKVMAACILQLLTFWLWFPWLCYGIQQAWRWNTGMINDLERKEVVLPPPDQVRPSKAEVE